MYKFTSITEETFAKMNSKKEQTFADKLLDNANLKCIKEITRTLQNISDNGGVSYTWKTSFTTVVLGNKSVCIFIVLICICIDHFREQGIKVTVKKCFNLWDGCYTTTKFYWSELK